jgi:hypothetical protein
MPSATTSWQRWLLAPRRRSCSPATACPRTERCVSVGDARIIRVDAQLSDLATDALQAPTVLKLRRTCSEPKASSDIGRSPATTRFWCLAPGDCPLPLSLLGWNRSSRGLAPCDSRTWWRFPSKPRHRNSARNHHNSPEPGMAELRGRTEESVVERRCFCDHRGRSRSGGVHPLEQVSSSPLLHLER